VADKFYSVYRVSNLVGGAETLLDSHVPAVPEENAYMEQVEGVGIRFYRVAVEP